MTKFGINDMIVNRHTNKKAIVVEIERFFPKPIYVVEYDETGDTFRMNTDYEEHWEAVE